MTEPEQDRWPLLLNSLLAGRDLDVTDTEWAMGRVMSGEVGSARLAALLVALRAKGETSAEIEGLARAMRAHALPLPVPGPVVDIVGTGGDGSDSVNVSTMAAIVAAGAGARVVKHGNRSASSRCGSADVLEELGVELGLEPRLDPEAIAEIADEAGITFAFAPLFHPAMRHAAATRRELGVRTVFNLLGPLANPAAPAALALGVADPAAAGTLAGVLARQGVSALVFRGDDGMDEITVTTTSTIWSVGNGAVRRETFDPAALGIPRAHPDALHGGDRAYNAAVARALLGGEPVARAVRDAVLLNAAAGLAALEPTDGTVADRLATALERATAALDSGAAAAVLSRWTDACAKHAERAPVA
ncbi:anthranilate phosphoribosyltransferase [Streptomyces xiamenensis]|uniref:anthranilate phosphoribosyltransferase n=1 Tax=Streptomyces xiamenensis TaxID=408015 RepID=UPI0035D91C6B